MTKGLINKIPNSKKWKTAIFLDKGYSKDEKYIIKLKDNTKCILRISDITQIESKKMEYKKIKEIFSLGINCSKPMDFGTFSGNTKVYMLLSWVEGQSSQQVLPALPERNQYYYGIEAGKILKIIHQKVLPTIKNGNWASVFRKRTAEVIKSYKECGIVLPDEKNVISYIEKNIHYADNRPWDFLHGDYHTGNMIITLDKHLGIIDFNRVKSGDPWYEFNRMMTFLRGISISFVKGQIDGYFDGNIPDDFFPVLQLYTAFNIVGSIPWAIPFGNREVKTMLDIAERNSKDFNKYSSCMPMWYK